ncbi:hypothetical protein QBC38DRAFT_501674 [Podospora fimiseda]|uniref:Uncharacterized protein n=1 Tax=Podospora fimiseda TaxID=252190 RepID=A0AAN7BKK1_9PEZI|nr:hypothetical protein QBC38DRAFT_501674 [Podospora fimiseda]
MSNVNDNSPWRQHDVELHLTSTQASSRCLDLLAAGSSKRDTTSLWRKYGIPTLMFAWLGVLVATIVFLSAMNKFMFNYVLPCKPDGSFSPFVDNYDAWSSAGFFEVTLGMGRLTFSQAKVIDIVWDVVVGRGGQGILAYISWRVFADFMATSITTTPVTYATFWKVYLERDSSLWAIGTLLSERSFYQSLRHKIVVAFTVFSLILTLVFPTAASAMTGYVTRTTPYIRDHLQVAKSSNSGANGTVEERVTYDIQDTSPGPVMRSDDGALLSEKGSPRLGHLAAYLRYSTP